MEGASPRAGFTDVDLTAVTEAVSDAYRLDAEDADHQLIATISGGVVVSGDQELLTQALANLVENALRHTPPGTHISIRLEGSSEAGALLSVEDDGPAVAEADLPCLTDRFYRGERSRDQCGGRYAIKFSRHMSLPLVFGRRRLAGGVQNYTYF